MGLPKRKYNILMGNVGSTQISVPLEQYLHQGLVVGQPCSMESKENLNGYFKRKKIYMHILCEQQILNY